MLDHIAVHVPIGTLNGDDLPAFMALLGFKEIVPNDPLYEHSMKVRWFAPAFVNHGISPVKVHFVETDDGEQDNLMLGHFCVKMPRERVRELARHRLCVRNSGSGRIWMEYENIRVEVRP